MARYTNVNAWRRHSNLGRVTDQQLQPFLTPKDDPVEAKLTLDEMDERGHDRYIKSLMRALLRIRPLMEARPDKRCRPPEVSTELFVAYRKHKIGFRKKLVPKKKQPVA